MKRLLLLFAVLSLLFSCNQKRPTEKTVTKAVYHWKTKYDPDNQIVDYLEHKGVCKQYIRFFDVDYDFSAQKPKPISVVKFTKKPENQIVPVVYITNRTFAQLSQSASDSLALAISSKINQIAQKNGLFFSQLQIDCDWSVKTGPKYFHFLRSLQKQWRDKVEVSVTLRLHQVKFMEKTGVPPVNRATLMLYNVGDWQNVNTQNSLFDPLIIDQYLHRIPEYTLKLDLALPVYSQMIVYRNGVFFAFLKDLQVKEIPTEGQLKNLGENRWEVGKSFRFREKAFRKGDVFRYEEVNFGDLVKVKNTITNLVRNKDMDIILFHLEAKDLKTKKLKSLYQ